MTAKEVLNFQLRKDISYLFKAMLTSLEDIRQAHIEMINKLEAALPNDHSTIASCDTLTENNLNFARKKILDAGNDAIRAAQEQISKFNVTL